MHKYHIKITEYAEQDLEDIGNYVAFTLKNPASAIGLIHDLKNKMNSLRQMPQKHALDEDSILATPGVRKCHHKNYKIYYIVSPPLDSVIILRVLHMHVDSKSKIYRTFGI